MNKDNKWAITFSLNKMCSRWSCMAQQTILSESKQHLTKTMSYFHHYFYCHQNHYKSSRNVWRIFMSYSIWRKVSNRVLESWHRKKMTNIKISIKKEFRKTEKIQKHNETSIATGSEYSRPSVHLLDICLKSKCCICHPCCSC